MFLSTLITYINRGGAGFTTKAPMMTHNMNPTIERGEIRKTDTRKQVPLVSQEENIRQALRDYYARK